MKSLSVKLFLGFSLIELLITMILLIILGTISAPSISDLVRKNAILIRVDTIVSSLQFARMAAIALNQTVIFCKSKDLQICGDDHISWREGQIIVFNKNSKMQLLKVFPSLSYGDILEWHSNFSINEKLEFLPTGMTNGQQGNFYYCPKNKPLYARAIIVNENGLVYVSDKTAEGGEIKCNERMPKSHGANLL